MRNAALFVLQGEKQGVFHHMCMFVCGGGGKDMHYVGEHRGRHV